MKTTFLVLLLTGLSAWAQLPTPPATSPTAPNRGGEAFLRRMRTNLSGQTNSATAAKAATDALKSMTPFAGSSTGTGTPTTATPGANSKNANAPTIAIAPGTTSTDEIIPAGMIDFRAVDLNDVLKVYANLVQRTILRPAALPAPQIVLKTQTDLTRTEAIQAIDAVLALNGITMINFGDKFVKAVPVGQANTEGAPPNLMDAKDLPEFGQYVTHVVQLKYAKPSEVIPVLQQFAKIPNSILPIESSGMIVIRDFTENVKRMLEMIARIDLTVPSEWVSEVIPIKYAKASEISDALNSLGGVTGGTMGSRSSGVGGTAMSGARTGGSGMGGMGGINRGGFGSVGGMQSGNSPFGSTAGISGGAAGTLGSSTGGSFTDRLKSLVSKASSSGSGDIQIFGQMKMLADERSNSLLVFASKQDMEMLKSVIAKLDVVLAQVLIETLILDVQVGRGWNFGVSAGQNPKGGEFQRGGVANNGGNSLGTLGQFFGGAIPIGTNSSGTASFPASSGLSYFGRYKGNLDVAVQAAASDSRVNVVQRPQILTTHAKPGSIFVGSTVPYVTSSSYGGAYGNGNSYQQLQVGIGLQVTPYINQEGLVVMQIDETIDEISGSQEIQGVGAVPTTTSRKLSAEVAVKDGETIILGGFIRNDETKNSSGVPYLMDIPLLGNLFKSKSNQKDRKEMMVLMRPKVLKTPELAAIASNEQKQTLPGILRAEAELKTEENRQLDEDKKIMDAENRKNAKRKKSAAKDPAVQEPAAQKPVSAADDSMYIKPATSAADDSFYAKPKTSAKPL